MTATEYARAFHNAVSEVVAGYARVLEMLAAENAALRLRNDELEKRIRETPPVQGEP